MIVIEFSDAGEQLGGGLVAAIAPVGEHRGDRKPAQARALHVPRGRYLWSFTASHGDPACHARRPPASRWRQHPPKAERLIVSQRQIHLPIISDLCTGVEHDLRLFADSLVGVPLTMLLRGIALLAVTLVMLGRPFSWRASPLNPVLRAR